MAGNFWETRPLTGFLAAANNSRLEGLAKLSLESKISTSNNHKTGQSTVHFHDIGTWLSLTRTGPPGFAVHRLKPFGSLFGLERSHARDVHPGAGPGDSAKKPELGQPPVLAPWF